MDQFTQHFGNRQSYYMKVSSRATPYSIQILFPNLLTGNGIEISHTLHRIVSEAQFDFWRVRQELSLLAKSLCSAELNEKQTLFDI